MVITTTTERVSKLKTILIGTSIIAIVGVGIIGKDLLTPSNEINGRFFTDNEYGQLKRELVLKMKNRSTDSPTHQEFLDWLIVVNRECPNIVLLNVDNDIIDKINSKLETGC